MMAMAIYNAVEHLDWHIDNSQQEALKLARLIADNHGQAIMNGRQLITALAQLAEIRARDAAACNTLFARVLSHYESYTTFSAIDLNGDIFCNATPLTAPINVADRSWYQRVRQTSEFTVGDYQIGRISGKPVIVLAHPVFGDDGQVQAFVTAGLDLSWLNHLIVEAKLPAGSVVTVQDRNSTILAHHPDGEKWVGKSTPDNAVVKAALAQDEGVLQTFGLDGVERLYAFTRLRGIPESGIYVSVGIPVEIAYAYIYWVLGRDLGSLTIIGALVIIATWIVGDRYLLRRFDALIVTAKRLQNGDLSARSGITTHGDLGELISAFDNMAEALEWHDQDRKQREEELRENERRLHEMVEETRRAASRAEALVHAANLLNAQHNLEVILGIICEETSTALNVPLVNISLYDEQRDLLYVAHHIGAPPEYRTLATPTPRSVYDSFVQQLGTNLIVFPDVQAVPGLPDHSLYAKFNIRSAADISMTREGKLVGVLGIGTIGEPRTFDENELTLLRGLASQAAQAISNAQLFEESARRLQHTQALRQIDMAITASLDLRLIFNVVLEHAMLLLKVDAADVLLLRESGLLEYAAGKGFRTSEASQSRLRLGEGYVGQAVMERRTIHIRDLSRANDSPTTSHISAKENFVSYYCVPLIAKGEVKGVLEVFHRATLTPDSEWLEFLETLAGQAAIAIDSITLFNNLQRSNAELVSAYENTLEGWSHALDLRDKETEGHTQRVTEMTLKLAQFAGVSEMDLIHIRRGALLHDIGKMGVPDSILLKPDPLSQEEWIIMRKHPQYAYELLSPIAYLRPALDIPYCHHEKLDGTGYPRGLKGEQIPFAARLFTVVDIWDALTSDRPYRAAWSKEKAREHLKSLAGTHLDPRAVDLFLGIIA